MLIKFGKIMIKKFIWIMNALQVLEALASGKRLVGELYIDIPKKVGMASVISILERDTKIAKETLIDFELINRV